jgi:hypothetical protein
VPINISVPSEFGNGEVLVMDGYVGDIITNLPTITVYAKDSRAAIIISIEPSFALIYISSDIKVKKLLHKCSENLVFTYVIFVRFSNLQY